MKNLITAAVKTAVAAVIMWLSVRGIEVDSVALEVVLVGFATGVVNLILNFLGTKFPWVNQIVSLFLTKDTASYETQ